MPETERFHLGHLLSITTGVMLSPDGVGGIYRIIDHTTGQPHMTHQLPRAAEEIAPYLTEQHPWLAEITCGGFDNEADYHGWMDEQVARYGEWHAVTPMPPGQYVGRNPLEELREMAPGVPIIAVEMPEGGADPR
ncbi:hypothetical protein [Amycolatopsis sp. NPDC006125]|uniref:DUF7736 domain-containing protein n=1 Tax=Amycolatopsis sp. NPDC006125 TaxID=3156730 RepID=UPI0033BD99F8